MLTLKKGNIEINGIPSEDPEKIYHHLKDLAEESDHELKKITLIKNHSK